MKLLELEITNIRGIRHLLLEPAGRNVVIYGPNGSGKSAVVDAIDFLLTGKMSRLAGQGTAGITLKDHGPHIERRCEEAIVRAVIKLPDRDDPVEVSRCLARPLVLQCDKMTAPALSYLAAAAARGHHVLTRRDILRYITAQGSTRAEEIQKLLDITDVEDVRRSLVKVNNNITKDLDAAQRNLHSAQGRVNATVGLPVFQPSFVLEVVNRCRAVLGAAPLEVATSAHLREGIRLPAAAVGGQTINVTLLEEDLRILSNVLSAESQSIITGIASELETLTTDARSNPVLMKALSQQELVRLGLDLLDETGNCPLCDTVWPPEDLRAHLQRKAEQAGLAAQLQERASSQSSILSVQIATLCSSVAKVMAVAELMGLTIEATLLARWLTKLKELSEALGSLFDKYPPPGCATPDIARLMAPDTLTQVANLIITKAREKYPEATVEQTAWDKLTGLEHDLKALEQAEGELKTATLASQRATTLLEQFEQARDSVLRKLYDDVRDQFVALYKQLHGPDEGAFQARLEPDGAALDFEVDFYGHGSHPPQALHSEGHQDSMGLCLYLALAERLTSRAIALTILDDVVMSIDAEHRRSVARLLATAFPERQFIITTHDRTWAGQLRLENVVSSKCAVEFYGWSLQGGPQVSREADCWGMIRADLERNDVPSAAARLRRASEQYFGLVCDSLQAHVRYRLDQRYELGDLLPSAMARYGGLLAKAKTAANSWDHREHMESLKETESIVRQVFALTNAEQWAVNSNVHYNQWANFDKHDFMPVVQAFQDLFEVFRCQGCGGMVQVITDGDRPRALACSCGAMNWTLVPRPVSPKADSDVTLRD